jgi:HSP20 family protein
MAQSPETQTPHQNPSQGPATQASAATDKAAGATRDATRAAGAATDRAIDVERRSFAQGAETARQSAQAGLDATRQTTAKNLEAAHDTMASGAHTVREIAARAAGASRRLTETGRQTTHDVADLWRLSLEPLPGLQLEMTRLFDDFWRGAFGLSGLPSMRASRPFAGLSAASLFGQPPADVKETEHAYLIAIEAPGLDPDDLDLSIEGDALAVCGHKAEEREDATATYRISERRFGRFERRFPLTPDVERDNIEAQYRDGVLKITLPKRSEGERQRQRSKIEVRREAGGHAQHGG